MNVYVATKNAGKFHELEAIFAKSRWSMLPYPNYADVTEGADSYEANAALKARALFAQMREHGIRANVLGDDSGLEVTALSGRPGVLSARYGGPNATWHDRRIALLREVDAAASERSAAFVCALHFIDASGLETTTIQRLYGSIALTERGEAGFSYDSIFTYPPLAATFGELEEHVKNEVSHRALAAHDLLSKVATKAEATEMQKVVDGGT